MAQEFFRRSAMSSYGDSKSLRLWTLIILVTLGVFVSVAGLLSYVTWRLAPLWH